jgi:hypothetical protein
MKYKRETNNMTNIVDDDSVFPYTKEDYIIMKSKKNISKEMHPNLKEYMEYCHYNGYVTPRIWSIKRMINR